jgi:outer membrane receptor protein involved in Fe transport
MALMPSRRSCAAALLAVAGLTSARMNLAAQTLPTGRIVGRVIDAATGQGVSDAGVHVVGTTLGTQSGVDGRFSLSRITAGTVTIQVRRIGFIPKTVTGILLGGNQTVEQSISLVASATQVSATVVTATVEKGTVNEALDQQRTAVGVVNSITAEQIAKSPDGDASQAVQRVSGVTVQDDRSVAVRGLSDRYTVALINGARVPSPEPEKRIVPLDLFPSGLIQTVTTSKTFTPNQQGDFAGALVDIKTREFPARRTVSAQFVGGYTAGTSGAKLLSPRGVGGEAFGMAGSARNLPDLVASLGNFQNVDLSHSPGDRNLIINQFRNAWSPTTTTAPPNSAASMSIGGNDPILGQRIGYLFSSSYSFSTDQKDNQLRALADRGNTPGETKPIDVFTGETGSQSVLWGGLANVSTMFGQGSRLAFNGLYNRTADNSARIETGHFENEGIDAEIVRMDYIQRAVSSAQLVGEHEYGSQRFDWAVSSSGVHRDEPDRSEYVEVITPNPSGGQTLRWLATGNGGAVRTFSALSEHSVESKGDYQWNFSGFGRDHSLKIGGLARQTTRNADTRAYSISAPGAGDSVTTLDAEQIFDGRFTRPGYSVFTIAPLAQGGSYDAHDHLAAGYAMFELGLSSKARFIGGARYESDRLNVNALSTLGNPLSIHKNWDDVLPSAALNLQLSDAQQVRFSVSRTLARPEYREIAPIETRDVLNGDDVLGNDELQRTSIVNGDARWEWYPRSGEVLSFGVFAKQFTNPIERVYQAAGSGTRVVFYTNALSATNYGAEIEARKNLAFIAPVLERFEGFANVTVMESRIHLGDDTRASATNKSRRMVGQAPYVLNGGLTYLTQGNSTSATLLFNRVGPRIYAAGDSPLPDVLEEPRNVLDLSIRLPVAGAFSARIDAKNLMDSPYVVQQGTVTRERYRTGQIVQAGLVWRP